MPIISYEGKTYQCRESETMLDALMRQGASLPFSCRHGICHVCLMRRVSGNLDGDSQAGIKDSLRELGYFLPCRCHPQEDMEIAAPRTDDLFTQAVVADKQMLGPSICRLLLEPVTVFDYHPGQFLNLRRPDGLTRSYSLASVPGSDYFLELHVRRMENGRMSNWIFDELKVDDEVDIHGPAGDNYYDATDPDQPMLLVATGTGLAPLWGVARDALQRGHKGSIHLYHGSHGVDGLYMHEALMQLQYEHPSFRYHPCVSGAGAPAGMRAGRADMAALADYRSLEGWRVHLSGIPEMVHAMHPAVCAVGADLDDVRADPFELTNLREHEDKQAAPVPGRRATDHATPPWRKPEVPFPSPDEELWAVLNEDNLLTEILTDFYTRVYADPQLSPFFRNVTKRRLIEKQYSFLKRAFTGELSYFGERPRNAHHWMVISDELFDYRENLLLSVAREHGLAEKWVERWHAAEAVYRPDIVKDAPWPRVVGGQELPLDGFGEMVLDEGSLCNSCEQPIERGETVRYHLRTGETYCAVCAALESPDQPKIA